MSCTRVARRLAGPTVVFLLAAALVAMLLSAASVPHVHAGSTPGLFNQDHDLSTLVALNGAALLPDVLATATLVLVASPPLALAARRPAAAPQRHADPRAPPVR